MQIKYWEMGIKIPFPATAEKSDVNTASFAQSFMKQAACKCQSLNAHPSLSASWTTYSVLKSFNISNWWHVEKGISLSV